MRLHLVVSLYQAFRTYSFALAAWSSSQNSLYYIVNSIDGKEFACITQRLEMES